MPEGEFKIGIIQMKCVPDVRENTARAISFIRDAAKKGANVICLQELFRSRYFCVSEDHSNFSLSEPVLGPGTDELSNVAAECGIALVAPIFEKRAPGVYHNSAAVFDADGSLLGLYRKMHIPDDPLYYEKFYFAPGDLGYKVFQTAFGRIGVLICWDQWYPEASRLLALKGADVVFYPTAIGWHPKEKSQWGASQRDSWITIQRSHAIANGIFTASPNRTGTESGPCGALEFWGSSFVCDPYGRITAQAEADKESILVADVSRKLIEEARTHWPFLRDRRIDTYDGITERYLD